MNDAPGKNDRLLAAEYALGLLEGELLRTADLRFGSDPVFRRDVEEWQGLLSPLAEGIKPVAPPADILGRLERVLFQSVTVDEGGLWTSLPFWRWLSAAGGGLAAAAVAALLFLPPGGLLVHQPAQGPLVATLTAGGTAPALVARVDAGGGNLVIRVSVTDPEGAGRVPELWVIPGDGIPRSLGVLDAAGGDLAVDASDRTLLVDGATLAVSLEPLGGSPTGAPTGPVVASGKLQAL